VPAYIYGVGLHYFVPQAGETGVSSKAVTLDGAGPPSLWPDYWKNVGDYGDLECFVSSMHEKVELTELAKHSREAYTQAFGKAPTDYKSRSIHFTLKCRAGGCIRRLPARLFFDETLAPPAGRCGIVRRSGGGHRMLSPCLPMLLAVALVFPLGVLVEVTLIRPTCGNDMYSLILTFILSIVLQNAYLLIFGPYPNKPPIWEKGSTDAFGRFLYGSGRCGLFCCAGSRRRVSRSGAIIVLN